MIAIFNSLVLSIVKLWNYWQTRISIQSP